MTKTEAAAVLNVTETASPDEVRRAFQELFSEYQFRLTNAPTPSLKNLYHGRVRELEEARTELLGAEPERAVDLPTTEPTYAVPEFGAGQAARVTPPAPAPRFTPSTGVPTRTTSPHPIAAFEQPPRPASPRRANAAGSGTGTGQPSSKVIIIAVLVIAVGIAGFFVSRRNSHPGISPKPAGDTASAVPAAPAPASVDTMNPAAIATREDISIAKLEFGRADYIAGAAALDSAGLQLNAIPENPSNKAAIDRMRSSIADLRAKIRTACRAERAVAGRRGAELPTCPK